MTRRNIMTAACAGTLAVVSLLCGCGTKDKMRKHISMEEQQIVMPYRDHVHGKHKRPSLPPPPPPAAVQKGEAEQTQPPATQPSIQPRK